MENQPRNRSFFWPILLVGVGLILLLRNLGYIPAINLGALLKLWPLILIIIGLDIMLGRRFPWLGSLLSLLAVGGVIAFLVFGPQLGIDTGSTAETETFTSPREGVESVEYQFDTSSSPVAIQAMLKNTSDLLVANITHSGTVNFDVEGEEDVTVRLSEYSSSSDTLFLWNFSDYQNQWDVKLAQEVPSSFLVAGGSGSIQMDLTGINLISLRTDLGSGSSDITLPDANDPYMVHIESGSGSVNLYLAEETSMTLTMDTGSGSNNVDIPSGAALRVEVFDDGSGSLNFPDDLIKSPDSDSFSVGAWQSEDYDQASVQILIQIIGQGSGSINIH